MDASHFGTSRGLAQLRARAAERAELCDVYERAAERMRAEFRALGFPVDGPDAPSALRAALDALEWRRARSLLDHDRNSA